MEILAVKYRKGSRFELSRKCSLSAWYDRHGWQYKMLGVCLSRGAQ